MNRFTLIFVLTMSVLLGSSGVCWGADLQKGQDAFKKYDYATALKEWTPLAKQGNARAQYSLGWMYDNGQGVPQDYVRAHMWYNLSASTGDEDAATSRNLVGILMTPSQIEEAQKLARECAAQNYQGC